VETIRRIASGGLAACLALVALGGCVSIRRVDPDPVTPGEEVSLELAYIVGPNLLEPGAEVELDGTEMTLTHDSSSEIRFVIPLLTPLGVHTIEVTDRIGVLEILSIVLLFRDRTDTYDIEVRDWRVEIEVNRTATDGDDYVTWAPTFCRARLTGSNLADTTVVLTNDAAGAGGEVLFAQHQSPWPAKTTATQPTLTLDLPATGAWVDFVIAGKFGSPSSADKDTVIEAHENDAAGTIIGRRDLMVRVRKNGESLTPAERDRFLNAFKGLRNRTTDSYLVFQELHRLASTAGDEGHGQPAFLPWHRAMLLHVERELQEIDPSVALHYWDWDAAAPKIFSSTFMGAGSGVDPDRAVDLPVLSTTNPLHGWDTDLDFGGRELRRATFDQTGLPNDSGGGFKPLDDPDPMAPDLLDPTDFGPRTNSGSFSRQQEVQSHNPGHSWNCRGGHLLSPNRSSSDPLFYMLHSQVDRQWAYWQWHRDRLGTESGGALTFPAPAHYDNNGNWNDPGVTDWQEGSFLEDTMWPWDGDTGGAGRSQRPAFQAPAPGNEVPVSMPMVPSTGFPASPIANLWPPATTPVRPRDVIDYLGRFDPSLGLGFAYDDVPYQ
jgi:tyrosinase